MDSRYVVISYFTDLRDYDHPYNVGDEFPRQGVTVSAERIDELSSGRNKQHKPLIKAVKEPDKQNNGEQNANGSEQSVTSKNSEQIAPADVSEESKKYSKEDIEALKLPEIRELAKELGFKISSTSKDGAVAEFMEKQG